MPVVIISMIGRGLLAALFILAGVVKIKDSRPFLDHMAQHNIPGWLLPAVILLELGAGAALLIGWRPMVSAGVLGLFCVATAFVFHFDLADKAERTLFFKDLALGGALMVIAASASQVSTM